LLRNTFSDDRVCLESQVLGTGRGLASGMLGEGLGLNPDRPLIVFTISNETEAPIPLSSVGVHVATVNRSTGDDATLAVPCGYTGLLSQFLARAGSQSTTLQPGAALSVAMPAGPHCGPDGAGPRPAVGFVVHLSTGPRIVSSPAEDVLLRNAFEMLRSQTPQQ
jgi:hypothetical protein